MNASVANLLTLLAPHQPHLSTILDEVVRMVADTSYELRYAFAAAGLRELLREYFEEVAPDPTIKTACWYEAVKGTKNGVGRRQRIQFAIYQFVHPDELPTDFVSDADDLAGRLVASIDKLSKFTHVTAKVLATPASSAEPVLADALDQFGELFTMIEDARNHVRNSIEGVIDEALDDLFISEFFDEIDILSSHSRPQGACDIAFEIEDISAHEVTFSGTGTVEVDLQYGSDGDCRRGDGLEFSDSYPFRFFGSAPTNDLKRLKVDPREVDVDTSSFYE